MANYKFSQSKARNRLRGSIWRQSKWVAAFIAFSAIVLWFFVPPTTLLVFLCAMTFCTCLMLVIAYFALFSGQDGYRGFQVTINAEQVICDQEGNDLIIISGPDIKRLSETRDTGIYIDAASSKTPTFIPCDMEHYDQLKIELASRFGIEISSRSLIRVTYKQLFPIAVFWFFFVASFTITKKWAPIYFLFVLVCFATFVGYELVSGRAMWVRGGRILREQNAGLYWLNVVIHFALLGTLLTWLDIPRFLQYDADVLILIGVVVFVWISGAAFMAMRGLKASHQSERSVVG